MGDQDERRKSKRYNTDIKIYFDFAYDLETKVEYELIDRKEKKILSEKHSAVSHNISVNGLCFISKHNVKKNDLLHLEVFLPSTNDPINMKGEVRWCILKKIPPDIDSGNLKATNAYQIGVQLISVDGKSVSESVYFDKEYEVEWSIVLESVFGNYKMLMGEKYKRKTKD